MALRDIITAPDPRLRRASEPVGIVTPRLRNLMDDMLQTMYAAEGIGLAAIQIGIPQRIIVMDVQQDRNSGRKGKPLYLVDPEIIWRADALSEYREGCLSVPEFFEIVQRPERCRIRFLDYEGERCEFDCEGLLATCVQHEFDHLEGRLFVDHLSRLKRTTILRKLNKARRRKMPEDA